MSGIIDQHSNVMVQEKLIGGLSPVVFKSVGTKF
jgi:hypothetical protein